MIDEEKMMNYKIERNEKYVDEYIAKNKIGENNGKSSN